jgi:hypothetical protein
MKLCRVCKFLFLYFVTIVSVAGAAAQNTTGYVNSLSFTSTSNNTPNLRAIAACSSLAGAGGIVFIPYNEVAGSVYSPATPNCVIEDARGSGGNGYISILGNQTLTTTTAGSSLFRVSEQESTSDGSGPCTGANYCAMASVIDDKNGRNEIWGFDANVNVSLPNDFGIAIENDIGIDDPTSTGYAILNVSAGQYPTTASMNTQNQLGSAGWNSGWLVNNVVNSAIQLGSAQCNITLTQPIIGNSNSQSITSTLNIPTCLDATSQSYIRVGTGSAAENVKVTLSALNANNLITGVFLNNHSSGDSVTFFNALNIVNAQAAVISDAIVNAGSVKNYATAGMPTGPIFFKAFDNTGTYRLVDYLGLDNSRNFTSMGDAFNFQNTSGATTLSITSAGGINASAEIFTGGSLVTLGTLIANSGVYSGGIVNANTNLAAGTFITAGSYITAQTTITANGAISGQSLTASTITFTGATAAASNCNSGGTLSSVTSCLVVTIAGATHYTPVF